MPDRLSILSPTGHLGFTPIERGSFEIGVARRPDSRRPPSHRLRRVRSRLGHQVHHPSGATERQPGERDVFGAQQYAPLFDLPIPVGS
jgi:hypothetical protein